MRKLVNRKLFVILFIGFTLRLFLVFVAHHGDLNNNISWATVAVEQGIVGFYEKPDSVWQYSAPNQPPLTILTFAAVRFVWQIVEDISWWLNNNFQVFPSPFIWFWENKGMVLLIKLPAILADLGIGWIIYEYVRHKKGSYALLATFTWIFNPVVWYNSAVWGQTDSVVNILGLISVYYILRKKLEFFSVFYVLSVLFKGSLIIFAPILGFVTLVQRHKLNIWVRSVFLSLVFVFLIAIWFHPQVDVFVWLINLYKERILPGEIGYLTANAFNFWWLVNSGKVLDSTLYFGFPARIVGILVFLVGNFVFIYWLSKKVENRRVLVTLAVVAFFSFLVMTRIHERYLYPFFPYATILLTSYPALMVPYIVLSITHLLNLYHLFWIPPLSILEALFKVPQFTQVISLINICVFVYILRHFRSSKI